MTQQAPTETAVQCSQCGRPFAQSDVLRIAGNWVCGDCKPAYLSRVMASGPAATSSLNYAGVGIRFGARLIDGLVLAVPLVIVAALVMPNLLRVGGQTANPALAVFFLSFIVLFVTAVISYEVVMLRYWGATVGKMACRLKVVRSDGRSLGWGVSFGRFFMWNVVTNGIPYLNLVLTLTSAIMAGVDEQKRALHDRVCDTRVIYKMSSA